eukprot:Sdes_comp20163_c0_seq2m13320
MNQPPKTQEESLEMNWAEQEKDINEAKPASGWKVGLSLFGAVAVLGGFLGPFIAPALRRYCLPFVPAEKSQRAALFSCIRTQTDSRLWEGKKTSLLLADLGSGDGRVVIDAVHALGIPSHGYELNPWLVIYSRWRSFVGGTWKSTKFYC